MLRMRSLPLAAFVAAACVLPACEDRTTAADVGRDIGEAVDDATAKFREATREFRDTASRKLDEAEAKIEGIRARPRSVEPAEQSRVDKLVEDLRRMKDDIAARLRELGDATGDKWRELKAGIERAIDDLERKIRDASS